MHVMFHHCGSTKILLSSLMNIACADYFQPLKEKNITLVGERENLVDKIWSDRPSVELKKVAVQLHEYTGFKSLFNALF